MRCDVTPSPCPHGAGQVAAILIVGGTRATGSEWDVHCTWCGHLAVQVPEVEAIALVAAHAVGEDDN